MRSGPARGHQGFVHESRIDGFLGHGFTLGVGLGRGPRREVDSLTEGCESGRIGQSRKLLCLRAPWVQIPPPPPATKRVTEVTRFIVSCHGAIRGTTLERSVTSGHLEEFIWFRHLNRRSAPSARSSPSCPVLSRGPCTNDAKRSSVPGSPMVSPSTLTARKGPSWSISTEITSW